MQRILVPVVVAAAAMAIPAAASAATASTNLPCYPAGLPAPITATGTGFTAGAPVVFTGTGFTGSGVADPAGNASAQFAVPTIDPKRASAKTFAYTATDGTQTVPGSFKVINGGARYNDRGRVQKVVKWSFSGLPPDKRIYVHVRRNGKTLKTTAAGKAKGVCGTATKRLKRLPVNDPSPASGTYQVFIDVSKRFKPSTAIYTFKYLVRSRPRY